MRHTKRSTGVEIISLYVFASWTQARDYITETGEEEICASILIQLQGKHPLTLCLVTSSLLLFHLTAHLSFITSKMNLKCVLKNSKYTDCDNKRFPDVSKQ